MIWLRLSIAIFSGAALNLSYAPHSWESVVWWYLLPLLWLLWTPRKTPSFRSGFALAYVAGLAFFIPNFAWIRHSSRVIQGATDLSWMGWNVELMGWGAVFGLALYLALFWGLWGGMVAKMGAPSFQKFANLPASARYGAISLHSLLKASFVAAAWVGTEWLRGWLFTGFGWNGLGVAMAPHLSLIQGAEWVGVTGLSFLPVFLTSILLSTFLRFKEDFGHRQLRPYADFLTAMLLVLGLASYGAKKMVDEDQATALPQPSINVLLVQPNLGQQDKWNDEMAPKIYQDLGALTEVSTRGGSYDLVVWPESAIPYDFHDPNHIEFLNQVLSWGKFSLLTGCDISLPNEPVYTGASMMFGDFSQHQLYRKVHLVPFGEYLPFRSIPLVHTLLGSVLPGDFAQGTETEPLQLPNRPGIQIIPLVCFEDTVGRLARRFVRPESQLLVNVTNDGWFLQSHQNQVHLTNAIFRCIELRRPMARACNTGVTCFIDSTGRIQKNDQLIDLESGSPFIQGVLSKKVPLSENPPFTFYAKHGDLFSISLLGISLLCFFFRRKGSTP